MVGVLGSDRGKYPVQIHSAVAAINHDCLILTPTGPSVTSYAPMTRTRLRQQLRIRNHRLGKALSWLQDQGAIQHTTGGWQATETIGCAQLAQDLEASWDAAQKAFPFPPTGGPGGVTGHPRTDRQRFSG